MNKQTFIPPESVLEAQARGKELLRRYGRSTGFVDGLDLAKCENVSLDYIRKMADFFNSNAHNYQPKKRLEDGGPDASTIGFLCAGGNAGHEWSNSIVSKQNELEKDVVFKCKVEKVDTTLGIVFGYAIVCKIHDQDYYDVQGDHIEESAMLDASAEFMAGERVCKVMHQGDCVGQVVYGFPLTNEISKALSISTPRTGFIVGMKPDDDGILDKYAKGLLTGFSIGGQRIAEDVIE